MKKSEELFVSLMRCGLKRDKGAFFCEYNAELIKEAAKIAEIHSLEAIFRDGLMSITDNASEKMQLVVRAGADIAASAERYEAFKYAIEMIAKAGVQTVMMKGFMIREFYPVPEYRGFGDVDILIKSEDTDKAIKALQSIGYVRNINEEHIAGMRCGDRLFEMHTSLISEDLVIPADARQLLEDAWEHTEAAGKDCLYVFTPEYHFFYMILHIAKHFYGAGAGVRMFLDIALVTEKSKGMDWALVGEYLEAAGMKAFAGSVFGVCKYFFDTEMPEIEGVNAPADDVVKRFADYVLRIGVFGFQGPGYEVARLRQAYKESAGADDKGAFKKTVRGSFFPPRRVMERRYKFCRKSVFLLPAAHLVRIFEALTNRRRAKNAAKRLNILCRSEETAKKQLAFYTEIGL